MSSLADRCFPAEPPVALVAVGGYGRAEMSPHSDVDLLVLCANDRAVGSGLRALLYPLWDAGLTVGHALVSPKPAVARAAADLDAATSLLSARLVWGDPSLLTELVERRATWLSKEARRTVRLIGDVTRERHRKAERAGWALAPDLKDDVGGLRDVHVVSWIAAILERQCAVPDEIVTGRELLLAVREALHAEVRRKTDRLHMELQPAVARRLGLPGESGTDELMIRVHSAARRIEHVSAATVDELIEAAFGGPRRSGTITRLDDGVFVEDGALEISGEADALLAMRVLAAQAGTGKVLSRRTMARLAEAFTGPTLERWLPGVLDAFLHLLKGAHAAAALETLDHLDAWRMLLPEWEATRGRAQHDPYHRYTVDAHSFLAVEEIGRVVAEDAIAASAASEAGDLDSLRVAALLHDIGKGSGEDHSVSGERIGRAACTRMGLGPQESAEVAALIRHHLLLVDTAARRDLDDGAVIEEVAKAVGAARRLGLLYILSVSDARATGPECWSEWRAALVRELYRKAMYALQTGEVPLRSDVASCAARIESYEPALAGRTSELLSTLPQSYLESASVPDMADELRLLARAPGAGEVAYRIDRAQGGSAAVVVCVRDRPGVLARTAGVLALNRMSVFKAQVYSSATGLALQRFIVDPPDPARWERFEDDLVAAYSGRLALDARLKRKTRDYHHGPRPDVDIRVLQDASPHSTVIEVRARDALGLLYAIASGMTDLDLDIHAAKIDTRAERVVDAFYVRTMSGTKLAEPQVGEVARSIDHRIAQLLG